MLNKTFKGGLTYKGAIRTIKYLLDDRVEDGTAKLIRGNEKITKKLINMVSQKRKKSWSSGVLTFSENIDESIMHNIMNEFERVTFAGLNRDQYNILWVNHEDKGRTELHYIIPRLELSTGLALNPYYRKRDFNKKDLFQDYINLKYGLSSWQNNERQPVTGVEKGWATNKPTFRKQIDEMIKPLIKIGELLNRNDIVDKLREVFGDERVHVKRSNITVVDEEGKLCRLKGEMYKSEYTDFKKMKEVWEQGKLKIGDLPKIEKSLNEIVSKQAWGNQKTYRAKDIPARRGQPAAERRLPPRPTPTPIQKEVEDENTRRRIAEYDRRTAERNRARDERARSRNDRTKWLIKDYTRAERSDYQSLRESTELRQRTKRDVGVAQELTDTIGRLVDKVGELVDTIMLRKSQIKQEEEEYDRFRRRIDEYSGVSAEQSRAREGRARERKERVIWLIGDDKNTEYKDYKTLEESTNVRQQAKRDVEVAQSIAEPFGYLLEKVEELVNAVCLRVQSIPAEVKEQLKPKLSRGDIILKRKISEAIETIDKWYHHYDYFDSDDYRYVNWLINSYIAGNPINTECYGEKEREMFQIFADYFIKLEGGNKKIVQERTDSIFNKLDEEDEVGKKSLVKILFNTLRENPKVQEKEQTIEQEQLIVQHKIQPKEQLKPRPKRNALQ